ncbi:homeobox protein XHOX-7.1-like [Sinocyclocheilus grahami]|uniref:homeobox protein XHOX-7.1-like n=1 Tax=Sinocyclocheilus grahami TaxID=75366 RepID=UPI0007AC99C1|nr:PREDICTED: homeobox protein XHOX-7.1-like [Sinocyclocheilus grahami]
MTSTRCEAEDHSRVMLGDKGEMQTSIGVEEDAEKPKILPFSVEALMAERRPSSSAGASHAHAEPERPGARLAFSVDVLKLSETPERSAWMQHLSPPVIPECQ